MAWVTRATVGTVVITLFAALGVVAEGPQVAFQHGVSGAAVTTVGTLHPGGSGAAAPSTLPRTSNNVGISEKTLDGHVDDVMWAGKDDSILFLLTSKKTLYRSVDGGKTWANQMDSLRQLHHTKFASMLPPGTELTGVMSMMKNDVALLFVGEHGMHIMSRDHGRSYSPIFFPDVLAEFKLHPTKPNLLLASTLAKRCYTVEAEGPCFKNLVFSSDFGESWRVVQEYVAQYDWARNMKTHAGEYPEDAVFASMHSVGHRQGTHQLFATWDPRIDFVVTTNMFLTHTVLVPRGNRFLFTERYLAVAQVAQHGHAVVLQLSGDGGHRFHPAELEYPMTQHSYTILDTSNDAVFMHVNHHGPTSKWGNVYLSNSIGTNFTLSLPNNRRDDNGKCDFEKLQSMEGVYIANYYENVDEMAAYEREQAAGMGQDVTTGRADHNPAGAPPIPIIRTVITFDRGSTWEYLVPPRQDAAGHPIVCSAAAHPQEVGSKPLHCSLHLHGVTDVFGPFYSSSTAVGLLMATGNVGSQLLFKEGMMNTYFSRDGGHEWYEVAKGSHIYDFGDHGGIIVMANDEREVKEVLYSWNEGLTWNTLHFSDTPVLVDNIMIESRGAAEQFILYGTRADPAAPHVKDETGEDVFDASNRVGVVFTLDFAELHTRQCVGEDAAGTDASDFERWAPSQTSKGDGCLMGRRVEYTRRKRDRACYNPDNIEIRHFVADCECTERDWECDRGYKREHLDSGACVRDPAVPIDLDALVPHYCQPGLHYHVSNGYRKVAGDSCVGGVQHHMDIMPCPGSKWHHTVSHGGWTVMFLLIALCVALGALTYCQVGMRGLKGSGGSGKAGGAQPSRAPLTTAPAWMPAAIARPFLFVVGLGATLINVSVSALYFTAQFVVQSVRSLLPGGGGHGRGGNLSTGSTTTAGAGYSSRGLGIPATKGGAMFSNVAYGQVGTGHVSTAFDDDGEDEGGATAGGSGEGGKHSDLDADFGLHPDDDEDEATLLHATTIARTVTSSGGGGGGLGDDGIGDLLHLPGNGNGSRSTGSANVVGSPIPTLRPPRSHDSPGSGLRRSS